MPSRTLPSQGLTLGPSLLRLACLAGALMGLWGAAGPARSGGLEGLALLSPRHVETMEELNRELGKLCSNPPPQARSVCRLHARLVYTR